MQAVDVSLTLGSFVDGGATVTADHFGGIETGFSGAAAFEAQFESLGFSTIRWPGGTLSETKTSVYGLDIPGLFDGTQLFTPNPDRVRPDLTDTLAYCTGNDLGFSMIVPTLRYVDDLDRGVAELEAFLADLLSGAYGPLPDDFTLEIGNEYVDFDVFADNPALYGQIADAFVGVIADALMDPAINQVGADIAIAVQMGYSAADDAAIRSAISLDSLAEIDSLIAHALPLNFAAIDKPVTDLDAWAEDLGETKWENRQDYFEAWADAIADAGGDANAVEMYISAMNVGSGATDPDKINLAYQDYGLKAASAYLELFSTYLSIGMDAAAFWGVAADNLNAIADKDADGAIEKPGGEMLHLMAENLIGMQLVDGFQANSRDDAVMVYAYENADTVVLFVAANDIADQGQSVRIGLNLLQGASALEATRLGATLAAGAEAAQSELELMLYQVAAVDEFAPGIANGAITFTLQQDYEVVMLRIEKSDEVTLDTQYTGTDAAETISGYAGADRIEALGGNDTVDGGAGDDAILGGDGHDTLRGGEGDDRIEGGAGNDTLHGGEGADSLAGGEGNDTIYGYGGADEILGDDGDDWINGGTGDDRIWGGDGADSLNGAGGADELHGGAGDDGLTGQGGDDALFGDDGDDAIYGVRGNDALFGGAGNDLLMGGDDDDILTGGTGNDRLFGGADADIFVFETGCGQDRIEDFQSGLDRIDLSGFDIPLSFQDFFAARLSAIDNAVLIDLGGDSIALAGLDIDDLQQSDFLL